MTKVILRSDTLCKEEEDRELRRLLGLLGPKQLTFAELKADAEALGFVFELQTWMPNDYTEDGHPITEECSAWKVTFPVDWPRPAYWLHGDTETEQAHSLRCALREYQNRGALAMRNIETTKQTEQAMVHMTSMIKEVNKW